MPDGFRIASAFVEVMPDLSGFRQRLQAELDAATSGTGATARVGVDVDSAKLTAAKAELDEFGAKRETAHAGVDTGDSTVRLDDVKLRLAEIGAKREEASVSVDTGDSLEKLVALDAELRSKRGDLDSAGSAAGGFSGMMYLVAAAVPVAAAGLPALGGALAGLTGTLGAAGLAFKGVSQAISDYMAMQGNAGQSSAQMAATQFSNATAIASAQRAISDAERQAGQDALTSAASIISAQQQVAASEHSYTDALFSERQAQVSLTQARIAARQQLQTLNNAAIDGHLSVRAAELGLQQAKQSQQQTDSNALSTQLQREQAALAVAQAERQLIEAKQGEANASQAAQRADKQGVDGNQAVINAKHALRDAIYGVAQAQQAERNAQRALALAQEQAAFQQQRDAEAVRVAQQNLANTQKQQQLQMAASGNAATKFARDMAELTGPQRQLVREFESFNGVLTRMEKIAGKAVLPGVTTFVQGLHAILPTVESAMSRFGGVVSRIFADIGEALKSKSFQAGLDSIIGQGVRFMRLLEPVGGMFRSLLDLWAKSGPATAGLATGLAAIATGFGDLFKALEPAVKPAGEILATLGRAIGDLGGPLGDVLSQLLSTLAPTLQALLPGFKALADALGQALVIGLRALTPLLVPLARTFSAIVIAASPLLPVLAKFSAQLTDALVPVLLALLPLIRDLTPLIARTAPALAPLLGATGDVVQGIGDVIGFIVKLLDTTRTWKDVWGAFGAFLTGLWHGLDNVAHQLFGAWVGFYKGIWDAISGGTRDAWQGISSFLSGAWSAVTRNMKSVFGDAVTALGTIWHRLEGLFKTPVNFLIKTVYDNGIAKLWDAVVSHIGLGGLKLPQIATLAGGGIVPGRDHGRDETLVAMRPEEGVLVPGAARFLGHGTIHALNRMFGGGGANEPGHFANGGILGGIGGFFGGIGDWFTKAFDLGRIIAAVTTGNSTALVNAIDAVVGHGKTPASGDLAKVMTDLPRHLFADAARHLVSMFAGSGPGGPLPGGGSGAVGGLPANWKTIASFLAGHGFSRFAAAGVAGNILAECVPADYQILTRRGWLKYTQIRTGDETIGYNPATGKSEWTRITDVHYYDAAPTVRYGNSYWSAECTPNHRWLMERIVRVPERQVPEFCPDCGAAGTPRGGTFRTWQQFQIHRARAHKVYGPANGGAGTRSGWSPERVASVELVALEDMRRDHRIVLARKAETAGTLDVTTQEAALLGWIAGDGCDPGKPGFGWYVYQSKPQNFAAIDAACSLDPGYTKYERAARKADWKPCVEWHLSAAYCRDLEARAGHPKRDVIQQVLSMSTGQRDAWLKAILLAEGCRSADRTTYYQNAGDIADAIEMAVYLAGHRPGRHERVRPRFSDAVAVSITEADPYVGGPNRRNFQEDAGTQPVWCPTTELGSWTARGPHTAAFLTGNSGGNPEILQIGGGGGGGLIQWTPYPPGYITGNYFRDLMTQLFAITKWGGGPGLVNRATSPSNAALLYQDYYERPASLTASLPARMASANAVYQAMGWGKFDRGGWMPPGGGGFNQTGQPEAVLSPEESRALITMAKSFAAGGGQRPVIINFNGTAYPNVEQMAAIKREMAMALGG